MMKLVIVALSLALLADATASAADRFAQPVRAGDLLGRKLIGATEAQPLLGHVEGIDRTPDGAVALRIRTWRLLPWQRRTVDVPIESVALVGELVALTGLPLVEFAALPPATASAPIAADATVAVALSRPFH